MAKAKKKKASKAPSSPQLTPRQLEASAKTTQLIEQLRTGSDAKQAEAAEAFDLGGGLPCFDIAVSPVPLVGAAIEPLVAMLSGRTDHQREAAAGALRSLMAKVANVFDPRDTPVADLVVKAGGILPLVALVRTGTILGKEHAASALHSLAACSMANRGAIGEAGGVDPLIALAREGTDAQKEHACFALGSLCFNHAANRAAATKAGAAEVLTHLSCEGTSMQQGIAGFALRNLPEPVEPPRDLEEPPPGKKGKGGDKKGKGKKKK